MFKPRLFLLLLFFVILSAGSIIVIATLTYAQEELSGLNDADSETGFWPVNPQTDAPFGFRTYIWTPKPVYTVGEPVPLYIERVWFTSLGKDRVFGIGVENPTFPGNDNIRIKKLGCGFFELLFDPQFGEPGIVADRIPGEEYKGDYIPSEDEIDRTKLHGNLVMPVYEKGEWWPSSWGVSLKHGDCFVVKIQDLTTLWKWCPPRDVRGVYRVQYEYSNIIEFEIR